MPYTIRKARNQDLYYVMNTETKKKFSRSPITLDKAQRQYRLLNAVEHGFKPKRLRGGQAKKLTEVEMAEYDELFNKVDAILLDIDRVNKVIYSIYEDADDLKKPFLTREVKIQTKKAYDALQELEKKLSTVNILENKLK